MENMPRIVNYEKKRGRVACPKECGVWLSSSDGVQPAGQRFSEEPQNCFFFFLNKQSPPG